MTILKLAKLFGAIGMILIGSTSFAFNFDSTSHDDSGECGCKLPDSAYLDEGNGTAINDGDCSSAGYPACGHTTCSRTYRIDGTYKTVTLEAPCSQ